MAFAPTSSIAEGAEHTLSVAPAHCPILFAQAPIEACLHRVFGTLCCVFEGNVLARRAFFLAAIMQVGPSDYLEPES